MAHFAKIDNSTKIVLSVNVVDDKNTQDENGDEVESVGQAYLSNLHKGGTWLRTSYNTQGGIHVKGGTPFRKNYAGIGFTYDESKDAFIPAKKYASWTLNESTCLWEPPIPRPDDEYEVIDGLNTITKRCEWNESTLSWDEVEV